VVAGVLHVDVRHAASIGEPAALTSGYRLAFAIGAALVLVALVVTTTVLPSAHSKLGIEMIGADAGADLAV